MSNYTTENLISAAAQQGVPAIRVGSAVFPLTISSGGVDVSSTTAEAGDVLSGKVLVNSGGVMISGTIPIISGGTITPTTSDQIISSGVYLGGSQTILGDENLVASNIVSGVSIFGVSGTLVAPPFDLVKVTSYTAPIPAFTVPEVYSMSGMTSAANPWDENEPGFDFSVLSGTYTVTSDTASATDPLNRVYKHDSADYYLRHYADEYEHYWLLGSAADMGPWDAMLAISTNQPLETGTLTWVNMDYDMSQSVAAAITSNATIPAVPLSLTGRMITSITESAYDSSRGVRSYVPGGTEITFSAADDTPVVSGLAMVSGGRMLIQLRDSCTQTYGMLSSGVTMGDGDSRTISSGWVFVDTNVNHPFAHLYVSSGGIAAETDVTGFLHVSSGGTANNTTVNSAGNLNLSGGYASGIVVSNGGNLRVESGGTAVNVSIPSGSANTVSGGGTASGVQIGQGGYMKVSNYASVADTTIAFGGRMDVYANATATNIEVSGILDVFGSADTVHVYSGGTIYQREGSTVTNLVVDEGGEVQ